MLSLFRKIDTFLETELWEIDEDSAGALRRSLIITLRLLYKIGREFLGGEIPRRASSLVYTTLLTIVPLLAVSFSVLKGFGVHNMLEPFLSYFLSPLGEKGEEITSHIIGYVDRINVGLLGAIGLAGLVYTVMNTVQQIENAFNHLWEIAERRSFLKRFRDYTGALMIGPILVFTALGITTSIMNNTIARQILSIEPFGFVFFLIGKLLPYFLISLAFTALYYLLINTDVRLKSALAGGVAAGILWEAGSWAFARFMVSSTQYSAIYSGFAILLLFMLWLYYNWLILLTGAKVSFYHQFPVLLRMRDDRMLWSERNMQRLAIILMYLIGYNYLHAKPSWTLPALMERLRIPKEAVQNVLEALEKSGLLLRVVQDSTFVPARDIGAITLREVAESLRGDSERPYLRLKDIAALPRIDRILKDMETAADSVVSTETVQGLVTADMPEVKKTV